MTALAGLDAALAARAAPVALWWRDDDAGPDDLRLDRLLALAARRGVPVALATVPAALTPAATDRILASAGASVLQHGVAHADHALHGERRIELGGSAGPAELQGPVAAGRVQLAAAFGRRFLPVMVPPWNRMAPDVAACLPGWGFRGFSGWADGPPPVPDRLIRVDAHLDAIDWRGGRRCLGADELAGRLVTLLATGRAGPFGLLTHHLVTDEAGFAALDRFLGVVQDRAAIRWAGAPDLFGGAV
jgi:hypothetical protein